MGWTHFSEIVAWKLSREVKLQVYKLLARSAFRHEYKYASDMRRAARSAPANIAEGFGRFGNKEFANFSRISKASLVELLNHYIDAHDQGYITVAERDALDHVTRRALKACVGLIQHLETHQAPERPKPKSKPDQPTG